MERTGPMIDDPDGYEYEPVSPEVQAIMRRRFDGGGLTALDPERPGWLRHGVDNWWDGWTAVRDMGDGRYEYTSPYTGETDTFDADGYWDRDGLHHPWDNA